MKLNRRDFLKNIAFTISFASLLGTPFSSFSEPMKESLDVSIFSKHLQFLDFQSTGEVAAELGFSGVDLTVRPKGHVLPNEVTTVLPKAISEIEKGGSNCLMITTNIKSIDNPQDIAIIESAAKSGIQYYRTNWFEYFQDKSMKESLKIVKGKIKKLSILNKKNRIIGCYQNHAGTDIGSSFWEIDKILESADPNFFGVQYDIRHAVVEGGYSWENGLKLLKSYIKTIVLKDFKWEQVNGKWKLINVPIGEGMVDFTKYFKLLKRYQLSPPASLHLEYPLGGAEKGHDHLTIDKQIVFDAMKRDLNTIQALWKRA